MTKCVRQHKVVKGGKLQKSESSLICVIIAEGSTNALPVSTSKQVIKPQIIQSVLTHTYIQKITHKKKQPTNIKHKIFKELVPSVLPLLKKCIRLGHADF